MDKFAEISLQIAVLLLFLMQVVNIDSLEIDEVNCGIDEDPNVHQGIIDDVKKYPWMGIFYYLDELNDYRAVTPVVLIQNEFVLANAADIGPIPKNNFSWVAITSGIPQGSVLAPLLFRVFVNDINRCFLLPTLLCFSKDRANSRVLLGEHWIAEGRRVRNYVLHPEYEQTYNTLALIQLREGVNRNSRFPIRPICPAPSVVKTPTLYVVKMTENYEHLHKEVLEMVHIPARMCRDFYIAANLYSKKMRPPYVICAVSLESERICVWNPGSALVTRDVWGRWQLLGLGVRGPGCNGPARFLDMQNYYPWIRNSLDQFRRITITKIHETKYVLRKINKQLHRDLASFLQNVFGGITITKIHETKYVLRSASNWEPESRRGSASPVLTVEQRDKVLVSTQRFGDCDEEEKKNLLYRDQAIFNTDKSGYTFASYNMTIRASIEISCMTLEVMNGSAISEMTVKHYCTRTPNGGPCYAYKGSLFDVTVMLMFIGKALMDVNVWGWEKRMKTLDIMEWKWEEGSYYNDFTATREEYRGGGLGTEFGYEPLEEFLWVPDYDLWSTSTVTEAVTTETAPPMEVYFTAGKKRTRTSSKRPTGTRWPVPPRTTPTSTTTTTTTTIETSTTTTVQRNRTSPSTINSRLTFPPEKFSQLKLKCKKYNAQYETYDARMETMKTLVYGGSVRDLVDAGFYFTGEGDMLKCMCCGMLLHRLYKKSMKTTVHSFYNWDSCEYLKILIETRSRQRLANLG